MVATGECSRYVVTGRSNYLWMPVQDALWDQYDDYDGIRSKTSKPIAAILYTMHALCWLNLLSCLCRGRVSTFCLRSILHCGRLSRSNLSSWLCCASLAIESDPAADTFRVCGRGFRRCLQVHRVRGVISFPASRRSRSSGSCSPPRRYTSRRLPNHRGFLVLGLLLSVLASSLNLHGLVLGLLADLSRPATKQSKRT